ncbi:hypothetical protein [Blastochloris sulfoviridis]|uniref:hypothetical protein n=1 Tax=Blastochloris sulfoviridis TaxID=50712 RepID=UPI0014790262|nr:hypothetical protein [Blastochloris sulfoviridis]
MTAAEKTLARASGAARPDTPAAFLAWAAGREGRFEFATDLPLAEAYRGVR